MTSSSGRVPDRRERGELAAPPDFPQRLANRYVRAVTRISVADCTSGYRCWRREALERLPLDSMVSNGYAFIVEMLYEASARLPDRRGPDYLRRATARAQQGFRRVLAESLIVPWRLVLGKRVPGPRPADG